MTNDPRDDQDDSDEEWEQWVFEDRQWDRDDLDALREAYEARIVDEALRSLSRDTAIAYLARHGDAIDARVSACLAEARGLLSNGHYGATLVFATTAVEIMLRFMLVRPLVQSAFLSDEWAAILSDRIGTGRTEGDRQLLPSLLRQWGVDIAAAETPAGTPIWKHALGQLWPARDRLVHRYDTVSSEQAAVAVEVAQAFRVEVVGAVAKLLGFAPERFGAWSRVETHSGGVRYYTPRDPFAVQPQRREPRPPKGS